MMLIVSSQHIEILSLPATEYLCTLFYCCLKPPFARPVPRDHSYIEHVEAVGT